MDRAEIEDLARRWIRAIAEGKLETFDALVAPDVVDRSGAAASHGVDTFKARAAAVRAAFTGIEIRVDDLVVEGDSIAWRWTLVGTHIGPFAGVAPTGRRATLRGVNFQRLRGGRVVEHWTVADVFGAVQALKAAQ
ncbi:MAG TPA: ester cyclase [Polyangiaceae bacterium]